MRCREVDLGKWLGQEFRIVDNTPESDEDGQPLAPDDDHTGDGKP